MKPYSPPPDGPPSRRGRGGSTVSRRWCVTPPKLGGPTRPQVRRPAQASASAQRRPPWARAGRGHVSQRLQLGTQQVHQSWHRLSLCRARCMPHPANLSAMGHPRRACGVADVDGGTRAQQLGYAETSATYDGGSYSLVGGDTNVPRCGTVKTRPSSTSTAIARRTVVRARPYC